VWVRNGTYPYKGKVSVKCKGPLDGKNPVELPAQFVASKGRFECDAQKNYEYKITAKAPKHFIGTITVRFTDATGVVPVKILPKPQ
jgi:hypothetical protein